jgi:hypothetical protein
MAGPWELGEDRAWDALETLQGINLNARGNALSPLERVNWFFAGSAPARERLARCFYGREHVRQMASLSTTEILETLGPWLEHALQYGLEEYGHIGDAQGDDFLAELPTAEYVTIIHPHPAFAAGILIDRYPGERVLYDDLYERFLSGVSSGGVLRNLQSNRRALHAVRGEIGTCGHAAGSSLGDRQRWR